MGVANDDRHPNSLAPSPPQFSKNRQHERTRTIPTLAKHPPPPNLHQQSQHTHPASSCSALTTSIQNSTYTQFDRFTFFRYNNTRPTRVHFETRKASPTRRSDTYPLAAFHALPNSRPLGRWSSAKTRQLGHGSIARHGQRTLRRRYPAHDPLSRIPPCLDDPHRHRHNITL